MSDITWENRDQATDTSQAVEALADFFSSDNGIRAALGRHSFRNSVGADLDVAEAYAQKWKIPFDRKLTVEMIQQMNKKRWAEDDDGYRTGHIWVSSSEG